MQENTESLGNFLKKMREERNVSIEQVAYATRISLKMLRALEEDDHTALPAPTFVRGYLQAYAKYVRIDTHDLLLRYQHHLATAPDTKKGAIKSHYLYVRERYQEKRQFVLVIVLFAAMLSVAGTYFLLKAKRERNKSLAKQAEQIQKTEETAPAAPLPLALTPPQPTKEPVPAPGAKAPEPTATPQPAPAPTPPPPAPVVEAKKLEPVLAQPTAPQAVERAKEEKPSDEKKDEKKTHNLLLRANEDAWFRYQTDEEPVKDLTLRQGKAMMLRADRVIKIFSGNLGAFTATMNGQPVEALSADKRSKSVVLPASEASKFPLPLFPQFQTKTTGNSQGSAAAPAPPAAPQPAAQP